MSNLGDLKYLSKLEYAIEARDTEIARLEVANRNLERKVEDLQRKVDHYEIMRF